MFVNHLSGDTIIRDMNNKSSADSRQTEHGRQEKSGHPVIFGNLFWQQLIRAFSFYPLVSFCIPFFSSLFNVTTTTFIFMQQLLC